MRARSSPELRPTLWDGLVVLAVVLLAALCALRTWSGGGSGGLTAVIDVDGETVERVELAKLNGAAERTITANGYTLHVALSPEGAVMVSSDCPTQDCVHTGTISRSGQSIVCLPARVIVRLEGASVDNGGPDIMLG